MISKLIRFGLIAAMLAMIFLIPAPARAQESPIFDCWHYVDEQSCTIVTYFDGWTFVIPPGMSIYLGTGWSAYTRGQVISFLTAVKNTYTITGPDGYQWILNSKDAKKYWGEVVIEDAAEAWGVITPNGRMAGSTWLYPFGMLPPGTYTLSTTASITHPVNDGFNHMIDIATGEPLGPTPSLTRPYSENYSLTIIVQ